MITADALLVPTKTIRERKWFPNGPPEGAQDVDPEAFTLDDRVNVVPGTGGSRTAPEVWLGWMYWDGDGTPSVEWFVSAAQQFLARAFASFEARGTRPLAGRQLPLLALPVVGTGTSGAKPIQGSLLAALLEMLMRFADRQPADIVLVTKSSRVFSAAQSVRARLPPLSSLTAASYARVLDPRLLTAASRLAGLATSGQLVLFLGSGTSQTNSMPGWAELLGELASLAGFEPRRRSSPASSSRTRPSSSSSASASRPSAPPPPTDARTRRRRTSRRRRCRRRASRRCSGSRSRG